MKSRIYIITNLINNKIYIGQTNGNSKYYFGGGTILKIAIEKYGKENFKMDTIVEGYFNKLLIDELEKHYIRLYNSNSRINGYNLESGGQSGKILLKETKSLMSKSKKGRKLSNETKRRISESNKGKNTWSKGRVLSQDHKDNVSKSLIGKKYNLTEEMRENISKRHKNKIVSEETRLKMSLAKKGKTWKEIRKKQNK